MRPTRRAFLTGSFAVLAAPSAPEARAQLQPKVAHIGVLGFGALPAAGRVPAGFATRLDALRAGLRDLGYVEGNNFVFEIRWPGTAEQLPEAAAELARMKVDVIVAPSSTETEPARRATSTIPIVFVAHSDPVGLGHVSSLARPGGNVTGLAAMTPEITPKRLEILKATVPRATRFGVLWATTAPSHRPFLDSAEAARKKLGVHLLTVGVSSVADYDGAFARMAQGRVDAVLVHSASLTHRENPQRLAEVALKHRLPTIFLLRENVMAGGLMSYGPDVIDMWRRGAGYIDKILKGAKPAELPVEQASKFRLVINLKTAKALGLPIPPSVLAQADEVIE